MVQGISATYDGGTAYVDVFENVYVLENAQLQPMASPDLLFFPHSAVTSGDGSVVVGIDNTGGGYILLDGQPLNFRDYLLDIGVSLDGLADAAILTPSSISRDGFVVGGHIRTGSFGSTLVGGFAVTIPEPAATLLAVGGLVLLRRRAS